jgi:hypothetical protein
MATVDVLDENRTITATDGNFQDSFDGYGVHLYKTNALSGTSAIPVSKAFPHRLSPRRISIMQGKAGFVLRNALSDAPVSIYTIHGRFLCRWSRINAGTLKVPDGAYILQFE